MVRQRILEGARKWMGPWEGLVFILLRRNLKYFIFWRTRPPDMQISSHLTTTTRCPFKSSLAMMAARRPSMCCLPSTTIRRAQIPDPDTIFVGAVATALGGGIRVWARGEEEKWWFEGFYTWRGVLVGSNQASQLGWLTPGFGLVRTLIGFELVVRKLVTGGLDPVN